MHTVHEPDDRRRLMHSEWLFLGLIVLGWAVFVVASGKDTSWDFRNYHWYIPYAFLNGRLGFDTAVAHQATYYNPLLDTPFYLLATHARAWIALGVLGTVQGANIVPLYLLARSVVVAEPRRQLAGILALLGMTGSLTLYVAGSTYYDNVMSVLVLSGLALIVTKRRRLRDALLARGALIAAAGGFLVGSAVGLKLPEAPFALGFAAALAILPGDWRHRSARLLGGALGGVLGAAAFAGFWMLKMQHLTGNPLFPYFNEYFRSPLALAAPYRDLRFLPRGLAHQLLFPLLFSMDWRVADDLPFQDIRVGLAYILAIATVPFWFTAQRIRERLVATDAAGALFVFAAVSYLAWLKVFGIYRYILLLEMLAPLLIATAVSLWPLSRRSRLLLAAILLLLMVGTTKTMLPDRAPSNDPYVQATIPPIPRPDQTMILMTGEAPLGYLVPELPAQIPIVRIDGWMIQPQDGSRLTAEARARVGAFKGDLYVIANVYELARSHDALAAYGLAAVEPKCRNIVSNLGGADRFCPLARLRNQPP